MRKTMALFALALVASPAALAMGVDVMLGGDDGAGLDIHNDDGTATYVRGATVWSETNGLAELQREETTICDEFDPENCITYPADAQEL